jgi:hypothetical protein
MSRYDRPSHRVYMTFFLRDGWYVQFCESDLKTPLPRKLTFRDPQKIRELARRGEALGTAEARSMMDYAIKVGRGGCYYNCQGSQDHPHFDYHIHTASEAAIDAGEKPEKYAVKTNEFASVEEAIQYFVKRVNIAAKDVAKHFPSNRQILLFNAE